MKYTQSKSIAAGIAIEGTSPPPSGPAVVEIISGSIDRESSLLHKELNLPRTALQKFGYLLFGEDHTARIS